MFMKLKLSSANSFSLEKSIKVVIWTRLNLIQIERLCRKQNKCQSKYSVSDVGREENIVGKREGEKKKEKGEKCWEPAFSPFSTMVSAL